MTDGELVPTDTATVEADLIHEYKIISKHILTGFGAANIESEVLREITERYNSTNTSLKDLKANWVLEVSGMSYQMPEKFELGFQYFDSSIQSAMLHPDQKLMIRLRAQEFDPPE